MNQKPEIAADQPSAKIIALVLLLGLLWGGNSVSIKIGLQGVPPFALATMRFLLGFAAITLWSLNQRVQLRMNPGELLPLIFVSVIFTLQIATLNLGTQITEASRSTVFISTYPFFTALFAHFWVPGDRLSIRRTVGITLAFGGVLLTFGDNLKFDSHAYLRGDLIVLLSGLSVRASDGGHQTRHPIHPPVSSAILVNGFQHPVFYHFESVLGEGCELSLFNFRRERDFLSGHRHCWILLCLLDINS